MLRGNLSSRPFYNERAVTLVLALIAAVGLALTAFNIWELRALSTERSQYVDQRTRDERLTRQINETTERLTGSLDRTSLERVSLSTREANTLIEARTFSWTVFFGLLEKTMPMNVRLVAVSPTIERGQIKVTMIVAAKTSEDVAAFVDALNGLEGVGSFYDVVPKEERTVDDTPQITGFINATIEAYYLPPQVPAVKTPPAKAPASKTPPKKGRS